MNYRFVAKRFVQAFLLAFAVLTLAYVARGQAAAAAAMDAAIWAAVSAAIFTATVVRNLRRQSACALCEDGRTQR